ncbi:hypothetical protein KDW_39170 [Dictyobacter vulcani]|uniref:PglZ domain-containing protein n=1 Tax=Dictyobacter vulcani TaxID=2607529 RepID=A0A5J4KPE7_9CHLR|nr:hypothetical protein [Dictyobacter vulcani]GER89755.1 hypothetical protein KDW_39170 [Dictyobacter vulcani]
MQIQPSISVLPTITAISKSALIHGYLDASITKQPTIQILKTRLKKEFKDIHVFTQHYELEHALSKNIAPGLYALLYNALDHHCHAVQGFTDDESIDGHLKLIARLIKDAFERCIEQGLHPQAFVSSDHGSTLLPEQTMVLKIPQFAYILGDDDNFENAPTEINVKPFQRTRVCATHKTPTKEDLLALTQHWHYLQKDLFILPKHYLIPKGYSAIERRSTGWTHGGATPEEVVVATLKLQPTAETFIEPILHVEGYLRPGQHVRYSHTKRWMSSK